jgi:ElaB/YqjD/DUF883 family membrane-anchored ribosome-binding protein
MSDPAPEEPERPRPQGPRNPREAAEGKGRPARTVNDLLDRQIAEVKADNARLQELLAEANERIEEAAKNAQRKLDEMREGLQVKLDKSRDEVNILNAKNAALMTTHFFAQLILALATILMVAGGLLISSDPARGGLFSAGWAVAIVGAAVNVVVIFARLSR